MRIIVPFPAGGATDIVARALAERMSATWRQPVIVEDIAGATGAIGTAQAARAPRDGYTLIAGVGTTTAILKALKPNLAFDPINDFAPISLIASFPNVLVVRGDFPAGNVKELIEVVKANPGKFTYASSGYGGSLHLAAELFKLTTKTDVVHVPYTGSAPAIRRAGRPRRSYFRYHTVDLAERSERQAQGAEWQAPAHADGARIGDRGVVAGSMSALRASWRRNARAVIAKIADEIKRTRRSCRSRLARRRATSNTPEEFARFFNADYAKWQRVVKDAGSRRSDGSRSPHLSRYLHHAGKLRLLDVRSPQRARPRWWRSRIAGSQPSCPSLIWRLASSICCLRASGDPTSAARGRREHHNFRRHRLSGANVPRAHCRIRENRCRPSSR